MADVMWVEETGSTNTDVVNFLRKTPPACPVILFAEKQTAGKGSHGRHWTAPPVSLMFSLGMGFPDLRNAYAVPLLTGYAVADVLRAEGVEASVKWPNDVWIRNAKACGILCETVATPKGNGIVIGIGINLSWGDEHYHPEGYRASAVYDGLSGEKLSERRLLLACQVSAAVMKAVAAFIQSDRLPDWQQWSRYDCLSGKKVSVDNDAGDVWTGMCGGVDRRGFLRIHDGRGWHAISSGTVRIVPQGE